MNSEHITFIHEGHISQVSTTLLTGCPRQGIKIGLGSNEKWFKVTFCLKTNVIYSHKKEWLANVYNNGRIKSWLNKKKHVSVISRLWYNTCKEGILLMDQISTKSFCIEKFPPGFPRPTVKGDIQLLGIEVQRKRRKNEMSIKIQKCWRCVLTYIWNIYDVNSIFLPYYAFMMTLRKTSLNSIEFSKY